jgi:hypothetical protein
VETLDFDAFREDRGGRVCRAFRSRGVGVAGDQHVGRFFSSPRWSTACERASERPPLGDPMKEIVALHSVIGVILLSALSLGAVVAHAL